MNLQWIGNEFAMNLQEIATINLQEIAAIKIGSSYFMVSLSLLKKIKTKRMQVYARRWVWIIVVLFDALIPANFQCWSKSNFLLFVLFLF